MKEEVKKGNNKKTGQKAPKWFINNGTHPALLISTLLFLHLNSSQKLFIILAKKTIRVNAFAENLLWFFAIGQR